MNEQEIFLIGADYNEGKETRGLNYSIEKWKFDSF